MEKREKKDDNFAPLKSTIKEVNKKFNWGVWVYKNHRGEAIFRALDVVKQYEPRPADGTYNVQVVRISFWYACATLSFLIIDGKYKGYGIEEDFDLKTEEQLKDFAHLCLTATGYPMIREYSQDDAYMRITLRTDESGKQKIVGYEELPMCPCGFACSRKDRKYNDWP